MLAHVLENFYTAGITSGVELWLDTDIEKAIEYATQVLELLDGGNGEASPREIVALGIVLGVVLLYCPRFIIAFYRLLKLVHEQPIEEENDNV